MAGQRIEEGVIPPEADRAPPGTADAPAEGLAFVDLPLFEVRDRLEPRGVIELQVARRGFPVQAQQPCRRDETHRGHARGGRQLLATLLEKGVGVVVDDVKELTFASRVEPGEEAGPLAILAGLVLLW